MSGEARKRFNAYVDGLSQSQVVRGEMWKMADDMHRESIWAAREPHEFHNDMGGTEVCVTCWGGPKDRIHRPEPQEGERCGKSSGQNGGHQCHLPKGHSGHHSERVYGVGSHSWPQEGKR